jgi:sterol desaturase/sphingolipid hydroxylase (fatty acid hydroxylase superfamily)
MTRWLLEHQADLQSYLWLAAFGVVAVWETFLPRRAFAVPARARWLQQQTLVALGSVVIRLCMPLAAFALAALAEQRGFGLLNVVGAPSGLALLVGVIALDLANYAQHRLAHAVPLLWRFHQIHHCDLDVDCGTSLRHHPGEALVSQAVVLATVVVVGVPPLAVLVGLALAAVASVFNHGNIALPRRVDAALRLLVVTPDMHRIHHSTQPAESNSNFANLLPWWDWLFSTYRRDPHSDQRRMALGLEIARTPRDVTLWKLLLMPFRPLPEADHRRIHVDAVDAPARL